MVDEPPATIAGFAEVLRLVVEFSGNIAGYVRDRIEVGQAQENGIFPKVFIDEFLDLIEVPVMVVVLPEIFVEDRQLLGDVQPLDENVATLFCPRRCRAEKRYR